MIKVKKYNSFLAFFLIASVILQLTSFQSHILYASEKEFPSAEWGVQTNLGWLYPELDYASDERLIFHSYFGLFVYDLKNEQISSSLNLEELGCIDLFSKNGDTIIANEDGSMIQITPKNSQFMYYYYINDNDLKKILKSDASQERKDFKAFDHFINSRAIDNGISFPENYRLSQNSVSFPDGTFGALYMDSDILDGMYYIRGEQKVKLFSQKDAPISKVLKQSDGYYNAYKARAESSAEDFIYVYMTYLKNGDYAGICSLTPGLEYDDEIQETWKSVKAYVSCKEIKRTDTDMYVEIYFYILDSGESHFEHGNHIKALHITKENDRWISKGFM